MLEMSDYLFYVLALASFVFGIGVIVVQNPIYSALFLALAMIAISGIFVTLNALFLAGVQLIVYAGAVMVLFVMVLMLFDLKHELLAFTKGPISGVLKLISVGVLLGLVMGSIYMSGEMVISATTESTQTNALSDPTTALAGALFTKYIFGFEVIGILLLVIAVGAVTLSRISGGTHADS